MSLKEKEEEEEEENIPCTPSGLWSGPQSSEGTGRKR